MLCYLSCSVLSSIWWRYELSSCLPIPIWLVYIELYNVLLFFGRWWWWWCLYYTYFLFTISNFITHIYLLIYQSTSLVVYALICLYGRTAACCTSWLCWIVQQLLLYSMIACCEYVCWEWSAFPMHTMTDYMEGLVIGHNILQSHSLTYSHRVTLVSEHCWVNLL